MGVSRKSVVGRSVGRFGPRARFGIERGGRHSIPFRRMLGPIYRPTLPERGLGTAGLPRHRFGGAGWVPGLTRHVRRPR